MQCTANICSGRCNISKFSSDFQTIIDPIQISVGSLSFVSCLVVFFTYFFLPRLRARKSQLRPFLFRILCDLVVSLVLVVSASIKLCVPHSGMPEGMSWDSHACSFLGAVNQFALLAGAMWYCVLTLDMVLAIRNPFGTESKYKLLNHVIGWAFPFLTFLVTVALWGPCDAPGLSMFYFCWLSVNNLVLYAILAWLLYFGPLILVVVFSIGIAIFTFKLLLKELPASSETRRQILKQNTFIVFFLALETIVTVSLWCVQFGFTNKETNNCVCPQFHNNSRDLSLAGLFSVVHGSRGIIDLFVWSVTNSIRYKDFRRVCCCLCCCLCSKTYRFPVSLNTPLINNSIGVNKALRRDAMYCINIGILRVVDSHIKAQKVGRGTIHQSRTTTDDDDGIGDFVDDYFMEEQQRESDSQLDRRELLRQERLLFSPSDRQQFQFVDIEPAVFARLREIYGTNLEQYRQSFFIHDLKDVESSGMLEKFTEGKSGSFFYFSRDFHFIIKTVTDEEIDVMKRISIPYFHYMQENPDTFLPRFFGLHRVKLAKEQKFINVIVMDNIFYTPYKLKIDVKYDLKGSTLGRQVLKKHVSSRDRYKGTLKDLDLKDKLHIGPDNKDRLMKQLAKDSLFLSEHHIMDYSLLLGVHHCTTELPTSESSNLVETAWSCNDFAVIEDQSPSSQTAPQGDASRTADHSNVVHTPWFRQYYGGLPSLVSDQPIAVDDATGETELSTLSVSAPKSFQDFYFIGIIDILQEYNLKKKLEHFAKSRILCHDPHSISSINERDYCTRFQSFMDEIFD